MIIPIPIPVNAADLSFADLSGAKLRGAKFTSISSASELLIQQQTEEDILKVRSILEAKLDNAKLDGADLTHAVIAKHQLLAVKSLKDATLPNGYKYPNEKPEEALLDMLLAKAPLVTEQ